MWARIFGQHGQTQPHKRAFTIPAIYGHARVLSVKDLQAFRNIRHSNSALTNCRRTFQQLH